LITNLLNLGSTNAISSSINDLQRHKVKSRRAFLKCRAELPEGQIR
jgi:hypothetical protein